MISFFQIKVFIYTIKYKFNKLLTSTNCVFFTCDPFISLDLSKFNIEKVKICYICLVIEK